MRNADCGMRNRNMEDSYEPEEESSVRSNERRSISQSAFRSISMSAAAFDRRTKSHRPERT